MRYGVEIQEALDEVRDVVQERRRQINAEGWTPDHDDEHSLTFLQHMET